MNADRNAGVHVVKANVLLTHFANLEVTPPRLLTHSQLFLQLELSRWDVGFSCGNSSHSSK